MSKKSQHNNILLAVIGFTAVVILVGIIGFFTLEQKDDTIQGEVEVSEYRVSCKLPGRIRYDNSDRIWCHFPKTIFL